MTCIVVTYAPCGGYEDPNRAQFNNVHSNANQSYRPPSGSGDDGFSSGPVDTSGMEELEDRLNAIHHQLMQRNIRFKEATEGGKNSYQNSQKL